MISRLLNEATECGVFMSELYPFCYSVLEGNFGSMCPNFVHKHLFCTFLLMDFVFLIQEANETGALLLAKTKLEKQLEDLTWRLHLEKKIRVNVY